MMRVRVFNTQWIALRLLLLFILAAPLPVRADPRLQTADWQLLLDSAGVNEVLEQANDLITQEIANLQKAPLGFTTQELQSLQRQFQSRLGSEQLKQDIVSRLQQQLDTDQLLELETLLQSPRYRFLQTLQAQMNDAVVREAMRSYKVQVKENAPNNQRLALLSDLDDTLQQTALETELKVELRKQLLVVVTQMKTNETFSEDMLDAQLTDYRRDVEDKISQNALYAYLYLFKRTPSSQVKELIATLNQPTFEKFMTVCHDSVLDSFRLAREQLMQDLRLAKQ